MATSVHSFIDIFNSEFDAGEEKVQLQKIVIPIIQRDYAQGRKDADVLRVRTRFLDALHKAVTEKPITLDFVYGDLKDGIMTPLDGQQRLTTLFLLHWYAAKKENVDVEEYAFLRNFSYETRYSARDFCSYLVEYTPGFNGVISEDIVNQSWFPLDWKKDPTISSMLVMIDAIDKAFKETENIWSSLKKNSITFYFLPIHDMGLTDELYIKMNSRGKPLTIFEHFKAELERELRFLDEETAKRIIKKIDIQWTDLLWRYRGEDNIIDDEFLKYFKFVCDIICYQAGGSPQGRSNDEFELLKLYFTKTNENALDNALTLEKFFDCWCMLDDEGPARFLTNFMAVEHEEGKIPVGSNKIDVFEDCLKNYADVTGRRRTFPLNRIILLYAFIRYLLSKDELEITEENFRRRLRVINNLIHNSEDEISDSEARASGNRMPAILKQVDSIVCYGKIDTAIEKSFNVAQLAEETEKLIWTSGNPDKEEDLYQLEDHYLLQGQIAIVGLENHELFKKFEKLFSCTWDKVDCALMSIGFYPQREQNDWRFQFGTGSTRNISAWRNLFHKSSSNGFDNTHNILVDLLSRLNDVNDQELDNIVQTYLAECEQKEEYEWRYYYVKYPEFRPQSFGKYSNEQWRNDMSYMFSTMQTQSKWSENTYVPFLRKADEKHLSRDYYGQRLQYGTCYIICANNAFVIKKSREEEIDRLMILQNGEGIDVENRLEKLVNYIKDNRVLLDIGM